LFYRYDTGLKKPNRKIDVLNDILSRQEFLLGNEFTVADVAVASYLLYVPQFFRDVDLSRWPNVVRYMKSCAQRPFYGRAFTPSVQQYLVDVLDSMESPGLGKKLFGMW